MPQQHPATDQEWMTHVLNIHGTPFEHLCQYYLRQSPNWTFTSSRYPVEFPPSYSPLVSQTKNSELDLWGSCQIPGLKIELLVECKKNNPDFTDWVFFPDRYPSYPCIRSIEYIPSQKDNQTWEPHQQPFYLVTPPSMVIADDGRETKGNYQAKWSQNGAKHPPRDFTKTSNAAITDAANQIALATQALLHQERCNQEALALDKFHPMPPWRHIFLPLVVTTAKLWTCSFPAEVVDRNTGEIPLNAAAYNEYPYLFFTYALPPILQFHPVEDRTAYRTQAGWENRARFSVLIVQSTAFSDLLVHLSQIAKDGDGRLVLPSLQ